MDRRAHDESLEREATYMRGRNDCIEEIARVLWPPDGLDAGYAFERDLEAFDDFHSAEEFASLLNEIASAVRKARQERQ